MKPDALAEPKVMNKSTKRFDAQKRKLTHGKPRKINKTVSWCEKDKENGRKRKAFLGAVLSITIARSVGVGGPRGTVDKIAKLLSSLRFTQK